MVKFYKFKEIEIHSPKYRQKLRKALETTMSVCLASTSALVINPLTAKIRMERAAQYNENSLLAVRGIGEIRTFLFKVSQYREDKQINFLDARAPIKYLMSTWKTGNCEHQAFYLAAILRQQNIPALIYDIEDIKHTVVITKEFLLDPWIGDMFALTDIALLADFYNSTLNMNASSLNRLLSNHNFFFYEHLNQETLRHYFAPQNEENVPNAGCCVLF
ncbi:hypothetical protein [Legionella sp. PATHC035]|uniref:hypothetical protein n=1 Tax=Legionella sp. PATHC035 TaxID=2992040 RepID=UPI002ADD6827|nr:hypothetical protein [Legionella sp. PATHC035]